MNTISQKARQNSLFQAERNRNGGGSSRMQELFVTRYHYSDLFRDSSPANLLCFASG